MTRASIVVLLFIYILSLALAGPVLVLIAGAWAVVGTLASFLNPRRLLATAAYPVSPPPSRRRAA